MENGSEKRSGTYKEKEGDNNLVKHYANTQLSNHCYVCLLRFYLQKLAPKVLKDADLVFYWKPLDVVPASDSTPWFSLQVIGRNVLASMVKRMFQEVGIDGNPLNFSFHLLPVVTQAQLSPALRLCLKISIIVLSTLLWILTIFCEHFGSLTHIIMDHLHNFCGLNNLLLNL